MMQQVVDYIFDGSYVGFLTALFESFERQHFHVRLVENSVYIPSMFCEHFHITSDSEKAQRVLKGFQKKIKREIASKIFWSFLSEDEEVRNAVFSILQDVFSGRTDIFENFGDARVLLFHQMLVKVRRERHRMKAFIRFQKSSDGLYYCLIEPDYNVLPLISDFFKKRYADQSWLIYDVKRSYGLLYNLRDIQEVKLTLPQESSLSKETTPITLDEKEVLYQNLWKQYFKSTNIEARRNMKLHLQHVPKRYWKYLVEKQ